MGVLPHAFYVIVRNISFFYACNYGGSEYTPPTGDIVIARDSVEYRCGQENSGWDHLDSDNFTFGLEVVGYGVCGNL
jgi:hypothetical protein